ncbi:hypothetical protein C2S52_002651 [Perilla frutescens var. hirtella]|uniref:Uncharacterized protein n=1 Tax=Perilla frutescens var. hirtella TaxID=608512 RepID=A0AAD4JB10_PERFH|nr:hypothetical protein C2S52_002651 [Perilla frutescens var. hirtella]KAH6830495.1 hypothetical protein C2S53_009512 [Perilla frutescens var. hirtella]
MAMASNAKLSYHRLRHDNWFDDEDEDYDLREKVIGRLRSSRSRRFHLKKRLRVKIPNLKRFLRRKARLVKFAWKKVCKRLRESQSHFGDLFAGNYLFMQVTPTPLKYAYDKSFVKPHQLHAFNSRYSISS